MGAVEGSRAEQKENRNGHRAVLVARLLEIPRRTKLHISIEELQDMGPPEQSVTRGVVALLCKGQTSGRTMRISSLCRSGNLDSTP